MIQTLKLQKFSLEELKEIAEKFKIECKKAYEGKSDVLKDFESSLIETKFPQTSLQSEVLAVDIGGSNLRVAIIDITINFGKVFEVDLLDKETFSWPKHKFDLEEYVAFLSDKIITFVKNQKIEKPHNIGISFSFPFKPLAINGTIDADRSNFLDDYWGKGFFIRNSRMNVTRILREKLMSLGFKFSSFKTVNDVISLHLSRPETYIAVIVGTGTNIVLTGPNGFIYNTQSASFTTDFIYDNISLPAKKHIEYYESKNEINLKHKLCWTEVQISGRWLPILLIEALKILKLGNEELYQTIRLLETATFYKILTDDFSFLPLSLSSDFMLKDTIREIVNLLIERSTDLVSAELAGAVMFETEYSRSDEVYRISVDGALFQKLPGYKTTVEAKINKILNIQKIHLETIADSGLIGAGIASLL